MPRRRRARLHDATVSMCPDIAPCGVEYVPSRTWGPSWTFSCAARATFCLGAIVVVSVVDVQSSVFVAESSSSSVKQIVCGARQISRQGRCKLGPYEITTNLPTSRVHSSLLIFIQSFPVSSIAFQLPHHPPICCTSTTTGKMGEAIVGIIGMGDMGKMYARRISAAGWM